MRKANLDSFDQLLDEFSRLPRKKRSKTLLEISQFPRSELACSNILAFFLDPNEEHGLGSLCLRSLLEAASRHAEYDFRETNVRREESTDERKRLDLVVIGKDEFIVGIENKLSHSAEHNPYESYSKRLELIARGSGVPRQRIVRLLLSLRPETKDGKSGFIPVTYRAFFERLQQSLGSRLTGADPRFISYLIDFMNTITTLEKGTHMDDETRRLFLRQGKTAIDFWYQAMEVCDELDEKLERAFQELKGLPSAARVKKYRLDRKKGGNREDAFCSWMYGSIEIANDLHVGLETVLYLRGGKEGWMIYLWPVKEGYPGRLHKWLRKTESSLSASITAESKKVNGCTRRTNSQNLPRW